MKNRLPRASGDWSKYADVLVHREGRKQHQGVLYATLFLDALQQEIDALNDWFKS